MTYAVRSDANRDEIVSALRKLGVQVFDMQRVSKWIPGFPDLLAVIAGEIHLLEIKTLRGTFTDDQVKFHRLWNGGPIHTLRTIVDAECLVNRLRNVAWNR